MLEFYIYNNNNNTASEKTVCIKQYYECVEPSSFPNFESTVFDLSKLYALSLTVLHRYH